MAQQVLEEKQYPDGSCQYILSEKKSKAGRVIVLVFLCCMLVLSTVILALYARDSWIVIIVLLIIIGSEFADDNSSLIMTFSRSEFVLERLVRKKSLLIYRIPLDEIKAFEYAPAIEFFSWFRAPLRHHHAAPYSNRSLFQAFRYAVGMRDTKNRQYMVNVSYGTSAERKQLTDMLNERLSIMKNDQE